MPPAPICERISQCPSRVPAAKSISGRGGKAKRERKIMREVRRKSIYSSPGVATKKYDPQREAWERRLPACSVGKDQPKYTHIAVDPIEVPGTRSQVPAHRCHLLPQVERSIHGGHDTEARSARTSEAKAFLAQRLPDRPWRLAPCA